MKRTRDNDRDQSTKNARLKELETAVAAETAFARRLKKYHRKVPDEERAKMHREIRKWAGYQENGHNAEVFWQKVLTRPKRFQVRKHRGAYVEALREVLRVYEYICSLPMTKLVEHVKQLCELTGADPTNKKFDLPRLVSMHVIDYKCTLKKNKTGIDTKDLSRDAKALSWLIRKGIGSERVVSHYQRYGGGVDRWSRRASKKARSNGSSSSDGSGSARPASGKSSGSSTGVGRHGRAASSTGAQGGGGSVSTGMGRLSGQRSPGTAPMQTPSRNVVLRELAEVYKLQEGESLVLHLRGVASDPGFILLRADKVKHVGPPGRRRARASRLDRRIRKATAAGAQRRRKRI